MRDQYDEEGGALQFAWVNTKQQMADPLTKNSVEAFAYLRHVLLTGVFSIKYDANIDKIISSYKHQTSIWAKVSADTRRRVAAEEESRKKIFAKKAKAKTAANALEKRGKAKAKAKSKTPAGNSVGNSEQEVFLTPRENYREGNSSLR